MDEGVVLRIVGDEAGTMPIRDDEGPFVVGTFAVVGEVTPHLWPDRRPNPERTALHLREVKGYPSCSYVQPVPGYAKASGERQFVHNVLGLEQLRLTGVNAAYMPEKGLDARNAVWSMAMLTAIPASVPFAIIRAGAIPTRVEVLLDEKTLHPNTRAVLRKLLGDFARKVSDALLGAIEAGVYPGPPDALRRFAAKIADLLPGIVAVKWSDEAGFPSVAGAMQLADAVASNFLRQIRAGDSEMTDALLAAGYKGILLGNVTKELMRPPSFENIRRWEQLTGKKAEDVLRAAREAQSASTGDVANGEPSEWVVEWEVWPGDWRILYGPEPLTKAVEHGRPMCTFPYAPERLRIRNVTTGEAIAGARTVPRVVVGQEAAKMGADSVTDLNERCFLGQDIERWRSANMAKYKPYFDLAHTVNTFCQRSKFRLQVHSKDGQEVIAASLLLKMLSDFQAAVIVLERGLVLQGQELLRCALEALIYLQRVAADPEFAATWAKSDEIDRRRAFEAVQAGAVGLPPSVDAAELQAKIDAVNARIEEHGIKRVWLKDSMTGPQWQSGLYAHWSLPVHSAPRAVEKYVERGTPGSGVAGLRWGPSEEDVDFTLGTGIVVMLAAWEPIASVFGIDVRADVDVLDGKLKALLAPEIDS